MASNSFSNTRSFNPVDYDFFIVQFNALTDPGGTTAPGGVGQVPIPSTLPLLLDGLAGFGYLRRAQSRA